MLWSVRVLVVIILSLSFCTAYAQLNISRLAKNFLSSLNDNQRLKALYQFDSNERYNWHFVPKRDRTGIMLSELTETQKQTAFSLLRGFLSEEGFRKTREIIQLELILKDLEKRRSTDNYRHPENYALVFFGEPTKTGAWGWRFEGHHISFNFSTLTNKLISGTPGFMGVNPAIVRSGPKTGHQVLKEETALGFKLLHSLDSQQVEFATIAGETPKDIVTYIMRHASIEKLEGIFYSQLNKNQKQLFEQLLMIYLNRYPEEYARKLMSEIRSSDINKLRFGWAGAKTPDSGKAYYYRIHGPGIIIEFDNSQGNANHIHTVVRDLKNDFGDGRLKDHLRNNH